MTENMMEIHTNDLKRRYRKTIEEFSLETNAGTTSSTFTNGIWKQFDIKNSKAKGKEIEREINMR